jgi:3',5'-cyclic AMP phosphodiesterase CpdA
MTNFLVQLSDLHIVARGELAYGRIDTAAALTRAIDSVNALRQQPDAIVITGDLTDGGRSVQYARLRELLCPLDAPIFLMPGNHDDRDELRRQFADHAYLGTGRFVQYSVPIGAIQLVALDTLVPRASHGELCEQRLEWLDAELVRLAGRPVVLALHHPPFTTLIGHMDRIGLQKGRAELAAIVARHPNVERVICGHIHRAIDARFAGTLVSTAPAPAHQVRLDLDAEAPAAFVFEPPGFRVHAYDPAVGLVSHLVPVGRFDGPYSFYEPEPEPEGAVATEAVR